jgi:HTH-type transcriptional regulator/antitoxin HigA
MRQALKSVIKEMNIRPLKTDADYHAALKEIEELFDAEPDTPEGDRLEILTTLVEVYEAHHFSIPEPDPVEAIKYYMESRGLSDADLDPLIGSDVQITEILNRKVPLSLDMIRRLHTGLGIAADILIRPYQTVILNAVKHPAPVIPGEASNLKDSSLRSE